MARRLAALPVRRFSSSRRRQEENFLAWLRDGGATFDKLAIGHLPGLGREVVATDDFSAGEVLLRVPEARLLTVAAASARPDVRAALARAREARVDGRGGALALALFLAGDRSDDWAPYRAILARSVSHLPCFWPEADEAMLAGSTLADDVADARAAIRADCDGTRAGARTSFVPFPAKRERLARPAAEIRGRDVHPAQAWASPAAAASHSRSRRRRCSRARSSATARARWCPWPTS